MLTWIIVIIALIGTVLNVLHDRRGFILWTISNLALAIINAKKGDFAQAFLWLAYVALAIWGWFCWEKKTV